MILCLQSTCTLSVTVAGLGFSLFLVRSSRRLSGLVVVRLSGQTLRDLPFSTPVAALTFWLSSAA